MKIRPLADHVVLKRVPEEEKTKGGIIIPDTAKEKPIQGIVVAVGAGKRLKNGKQRPCEVKEGDRVLFAKYAGTEIKLDGVDHVLIDEGELLAVFGGK
jgi:chaperonin GroES